MATAQGCNPGPSASDLDPTETGNVALTSVRKTPAVPPQRPAGPSRCYCGAELVQTPGKRPRRFCNEACRSASRRNPSNSKRAAADATAPGKSGRLGNGVTEFSHTPDLREQPEVAKAVAPAIRRWQGRKVLNRTSQIAACKGCGRAVLDPDTGVIHARSSRGYAVTIGLVRCGKIWFCPECSAAIRRGRSEELKTAALRWLAAGGTLAVVVLTARHNRTTELDRLSDALWGAPKVDAKGRPVLDRSGKPRRTPGAYQAMLTAPAFYGRAARRGKRPEGGIRHRVGYVGMARASEVTRSKDNGWHPHMNLLVFLGGRLDGTPAKGTVTKHFTPGPNPLAEWEDWMRGLWTSMLRKADPAFEPSTECDRRDCKCDGKGHGVMVKLVKSADDTALIDYLTKVQDGKPADSVTADLEAATGAAMETARADSKRYNGQSVTPFQMLYRLWDIESAGTDPEQAEGYGTPAQCRAWWAEYETAMAGRRAIEWTRGLRRHVRMDGDDSEERDREFIYEQEKNQELTGGIAMTSDAHGFVVRADAELDVRATIEAECYDSAADVVAALGGRADHVRVLNAQELAELQEALFARLAARREHSERQRRIDAFEIERAEKTKERQRLAGLFAQLLARR